MQKTPREVKNANSSRILNIRGSLADVLKVTGGRMGNSAYRYGNTTVYNTFVWPNISEDGKDKIRATADNIISARKKYGLTLMELYKPGNEWMFPDLFKAHEANDKAVMEAYGFHKNLTEPEIISKLMKMYQEKAKEPEK